MSTHKIIETAIIGKDAAQTTRDQGISRMMHRGAMPAHSDGMGYAAEEKAWQASKDRRGHGGSGGIIGGLVSIVELIGL